MKSKPFYHLIGALILLLIALGAYVFWYNVVAAQSAKVAQIQEELQEKSQTTTQIAQAKAEISSLADAQSTIDQYSVSTTSVVPFLEQLQSTGQFLGSQVQVVSVSATPGTPYGTLSLSLSITGSFNSVMRALGAIEYGPFDTTVSSLSFDASNQTVTSKSAQTWTANGVFIVGTHIGTQIIAPTAPNAAASTTPATTTNATTTSATTPPSP